MIEAPLFIDEFLRRRGSAEPEGTALHYLRPPHTGTKITWGQLDRWADAVTAVLARHGVGPGDRCALQLTDSPAFFASLHAVFRRGAAVVMVDGQWGDASLQAVLRHADVRAILAPDEPARARLRDFAGSEIPVLTFPGPDTDERPAEAPAGRSPGDVALIAFTSGTTASPKGVMLTHRSLLAGYAGGRVMLPMEGRVRFGAPMRLGSIGVLGTTYLFPLVLGAHTIVLPELSLATARSFWKAVEEQDIQFWFAVPSLIHMLNRSKATPPTKRLDLLCATGAAPISSEAMASFQSQFGVRLRNLYGLAESSFAVFFGDDGEDGWGTSSIGKPQVAEARLVSETGAILDGASEGRLQLRGPQMSLGYFRNAEATAALFEGDWLDTGDMATRDESGRYFIHGRVKEVVMRGGYSVYLADVDEALLEHPAVQEASSVGVPDPIYGEAIVGFVRPLQDRGEITPSALRSWCAERLGSYRAPSIIHIVDQPLPRNALGKIMRRELLKWMP